MKRRGHAPIIAGQHFGKSGQHLVCGFDPCIVPAAAKLTSGLPTRSLGTSAIGQSDDAHSLIQARLLAGVRRWDQEAALNPKTARAVPVLAIGRMLGPEAAAA